MTSKERAYLKSEAHHLDPVINIGRDGLTAEVVSAIDEAIEARELIKVGVLKNCFEDLRGLGQTAAERTRSEVVQVMGRKITLYRRNTEKDRYHV